MKILTKEDLYRNINLLYLQNSLVYYEDGIFYVSYYVEEEDSTYEYELSKDNEKEELAKVLYFNIAPKIVNILPGGVASLHSEEYRIINEEVVSRLIPLFLIEISNY